MQYAVVFFYDLRSSVLGTKGGSILVCWSVHVVAVLNLVSQVFMDRAGLIADFDLSEPWHSKEQVLIVDETCVLWQALVVVPHLPVHAIEERSLCKL